MKKVIIVPNLKKDENLEITRLIAEKLSFAGITSYIDKKYSSYGFLTVSFYEKIPDDAECLIVVGGDGSVIDASRLALSLEIPILGVNLGKVGYLSEVEPDNIDILANLATDNYKTERKMLLSVVKYAKDGSAEKSERHAVNDVVISHDDYFGISDFKVENGRGDHVKYRADGVIVSTPVGSTAYSLSAGGPVIAHTLDSITVTPVCPHSFFNRSIVYGADECIRISNAGESILNISVDGRFFTKLELGEGCVIGKSDVSLDMITFSENNMFSTLFKKIKVLEETV